MEPHPVPKNILTVEFKLFGALTVKQFGKVLIGAIVALVVFVLQLPVIIGLPVMVISVLLGIFAALVNDFEAKMMGVLRSLVVSPRYVWQKEEKTPEALRREMQQKKQSATSTKISKSPTTDVHDISLDRLLDARAQRQLEPEPGGPDEDDNFARVYGDIYQEEINRTPVPPQTMIQPAPQPQQPAALGEELPADVNERVVELQSRLNEMTKQNASAEQKQPIIDEINAIYSRLRQQAQSQLPPTEVQPLDRNRMMYGITVDKSGNPVEGAQVSLKHPDGTLVAQSAVSAADGKFAIEDQFPAGDYVVHIEHGSKHFPEFKLNIGNSNLPAFKFREA